MTATDEPTKLADLIGNEMEVYPLAVAARLLKLHPETLLRHGIRTLTRPGRTSAYRVHGREILRMAGLGEQERAARTSEGNETEAEARRQVEADLARLGMGPKAAKPRPRAK